MVLATYELDSQTYSADVPAGADSLCFVCAGCGRAWGRVSVEAGGQWLVESVPCSEHSPRGVADAFRISGSILPIQSSFVGPQYSATLLENLPPELVRREYQIHLAYLISKGLIPYDESEESIFPASGSPVEVLAAGVQQEGTTSNCDYD